LIFLDRCEVCELWSMSHSLCDQWRRRSAFTCGSDGDEVLQVIVCLNFRQKKIDGIPAAVTLFRLH
jgi:hypothetical protein